MAMDRGFLRGFHQLKPESGCTERIGSHASPPLWIIDKGPAKRLGLQNATHLYPFRAAVCKLSREAEHPTRSRYGAASSQIDPPGSPDDMGDAEKGPGQLFQA